MDRPLLRAQPTAGPARRLLWSLGPAVLSAAVLVACGSGDDDPPHPAKALPPADTIPSGLDDALQLPDDVEPVAFSYTEVVLEADRAGRRTVGVLVADTFLRRTRGLMHRTSLPPDTGMLFAFPELTTSPFWNKDAPLDLDIAFLDETGVIREIVRLQAFRHHPGGAHDALPLRPGDARRLVRVARRRHGGPRSDPRLRGGIRRMRPAGVLQAGRRQW